MPARKNRPERKTLAVARQMADELRTPTAIARALDRRLGKGVGAERERQKLKELKASEAKAAKAEAVRAEAE